MYNIQVIKRLTGRIEVSEKTYLEIIWSDPKKRFIFKKGSEILGYSKPSILFWKTMFLIYKYNTTEE